MAHQRQILLCCCFTGSDCCFAKHILHLTNPLDMPVCLSFPSTHNPIVSWKVSSFCVYYSNPLTAAICLRMGEIWTRQTLPVTVFGGGLSSVRWLLFKNSSRANFHPCVLLRKGGEEFASKTYRRNENAGKIKIKKEMPFKSVAEQTIDKRVVCTLSDMIHDGVLAGPLIWSKKFIFYRFHNFFIVQIWILNPSTLF